MTKDWDAVQDEIRELSFSQKKPLEEVKALMERKYKFRASTRAYRMKLKEWGFTRHKPRKPTGTRKDRQEQDDDSSTEPETEAQPEPEPMAIDTTPVLSTEREESWQVVPESDLEHAEPFMSMLHQTPSLPVFDPLSQARTRATEIVMDMLGAILENDTTGLEKMLLDNINHVNDPIGLPFDLITSRFFNHPVMNEMVVLQHPDQTLLDITCGMPCNPIIWILLSHGAKGTRHPLGTDLALHNAIKNGRPYTVQALLVPGRSDVNGVPGTSWKPLLQAVFWNHPEVVRILLRKGANVDDVGPSPTGIGSYTALQLCLDRRTRDYVNQGIRDRCNEILKLLLEAGASIHVSPPEGSTLSPFEMFLKPLQDTQYWAMQMTPVELECLGLFISKGGDPQSHFESFPCAHKLRKTFAHQVLWHSTPDIARRVVDSVSSTPHSTGLSLLHEILGSCPDAKRHPSDTLRDIEVLLQAGVDPNLSDINGVTPLRKCLKHCPAVDLVARLQKLLNGGADPEIQGPDGVQPFILAARTFEGKLLTEVMEVLVSKIRGRHRRIISAVSYTWDSSQFPITDDQTYEQVMSSVRSTGDFRRKMHDMVPEDIHKVFLNAYFTVVSKNYLDTMTRIAKSRMLLPKEKDEIIWVLGMRSPIDCPAYKFDQELVIALLYPQPLLELDPDASENAPSTTKHTPFQFNPNGSTAVSPSPGPLLAMQDAQEQEAAEDFFVPDTSKIRCKDPCANPTRDIAWVAEHVLKYKCPSCDAGNLLTKAELEKHEVEHGHTASCEDENGSCMRRFCVKRRKMRDLGEALYVAAASVGDEI